MCCSERAERLRSADSTPHRWVRLSPLEHPSMSADDDDDFILWFAAAIAVVVAVIIASIVGVAVAIS